MTRILFVCMANICRSPIAEGVTLHLIKNKGLEAIVKVDSAGTHGHAAAEPPDPRAQHAALKRGVDLSGLRARKIQPSDFENFDLLLAMDRDNLALLKRDCPAQHQAKLGLFMHFAAGSEADEVPDPYYGGEGGFELVLDMLEAAASGLIETLGVK